MKIIPYEMNTMDQEGKTKYLDDFSQNSSLIGIKFLHSKYRNFSRAFWLILLILVFIMTGYQLISRILFYIENPMAVDIQYSFPSSLPFPELILCNTMQMKVSAIYQLVQNRLSTDAELVSKVHGEEFIGDLVHFFSTIYGENKMIQLETVRESLEDLHDITLGINKSFMELDQYRNTEIVHAFIYSDAQWKDFYHAWQSKLSSFPRMQKMLQDLYQADREDFFHQNTQVYNVCQNTLSCILLMLYKTLSVIETLSTKDISISSQQLQSDLIINCKWMTIGKCKIEPVITPDGYCHRIVPHGMPSVRGTGPEHGMHILLDLQTYEGFPAMHSSAAKIHLKSPTMNSSVYRSSLFLAKGQFADIAINSDNTLKRYRKECGLLDDSENEYYEQNRCLISNINLEIGNACGCIAKTDPSFEMDIEKLDTRKCISLDKNCSNHGSVACILEQVLPSYITKNQSKTGQTCMNWETTELSIEEVQGNMCSNPDMSSAPWCYVRVSNTTIKKEYCWDECTIESSSSQNYFDNTIIPCVDDLEKCAYNGSRQCILNLYSGDKTTTADGNMCMNWKDTELSILGDHNKCRAASKKGMPWCYVTATIWEYCFPTCPKEGFCVDEANNCFRRQDIHCQQPHGYFGNKSATVNGKQCQAWNMDFPHSHKFNYIGNHNFCRNPDGEKAPWCYTIDPDFRYGFCFPECSVSVEEESLKLNGSCIAEWNVYQCINDIEQCGSSEAYKGYKASTRRNIPCIFWNQVEFGRTNDHNYCRNPNGTKESPWCYTGENGQWDYCFNSCPEEKDPCVDTTRNCYHIGDICKSPNAYFGNKSTTYYGTECQFWNTQYPHSHSLTTVGNHNQCRNPDGEAGPWCYTTDPDYRWDYCFDECDYDDPDDCLHHAHEDEYDMCALYATDACKYNYVYTKHTSLSGKTCIIWNQVGNYSVSDLNNCRNPDGKDAPWCYIDVMGNWEYCYEICTEESCVDISHDCAMYYDPVCQNGLEDITKNVTVRNRTCLKWSDNDEFAWVGDHNYCRNPDNSDAPWCLTEAIGFEYCYESCNVIKSKCITKDGCAIKYHSPECKANTHAGLRKTETKSGRICQHWNSQYPHKHGFAHDPGLEANYCNNPDGEGAPWCYTTDPDVRWEYCYEECSPLQYEKEVCYDKSRNCYNADVPQCRTWEAYLGTRSMTKTGISCQLWSSTTPHDHSFTELGDHNNCRNPDGVPEGPWCYTTNPYHRWDYCFELCPKGHDNTGFQTVNIYQFRDQSENISNQYNSTSKYCSLLDQYHCVAQFFDSNVTAMLESNTTLCPVNCIEHNYAIDQKSQPIMESLYKQYLPMKWIDMKKFKLDTFRQKGSRHLDSERFPIRQRIMKFANEMVSFSAKLELLNREEARKELFCEDSFEYLEDLAGTLSSYASEDDSVYEKEISDGRQKVIDVLTKGSVNYLIANNPVNLWNKLLDLQYMFEYDIKIYGADSDVMIANSLKKIIGCGRKNMACMIRLYNEIFGTNAALQYIVDVNHFMASFDLESIKEKSLQPAWDNILSKSATLKNLELMGNQFLKPKYQTEVDFATIYEKNGEAHSHLASRWTEVITAYNSILNATKVITEQISKLMDMKGKLQLYSPSSWQVPDYEVPIGDLQWLKECLEEKSEALDHPYLKSNWLTNFGLLIEDTLPYTAGTEYDRSNLLLISVYFGQLRTETVIQRQSFGIFDLLADVGGTLGLYMGATVITIFEVISYICEIKGYNVTEKKIKRKGRNGTTFTKNIPLRHDPKALHGQETHSEI